jgi:hypothetical protein
LRILRTIYSLLSYYFNIGYCDIPKSAYKEE